MKNGERVSGRYKIIRKIGAGGMANVYLAEDLILEREVAVKMMSLDFHEDQSSYRRFQREALSTTELIHPNIVNIYDVGEGDRPYIVMEHIGGLDLKQYIQEHHPIPYKKVLDIMEQVLNGIAYAHANDVIHRDIKPHNILIDNDGNVKITDFGIAIALTQNSITQTNSLLGSVQYMSPEQARGSMVTKQSDIYSLGIVLYEMLTGVVPFEGESAVSIALKHFQTPIPSLHEFDSRIPQPLENVVLKATAKEPRDRYDSVVAMQKDLRTALSPERRDEERFVPKDLNNDDTLVLGPIVAEVNSTLKSQEKETDEVEEAKNTEKAPKKKKRKRWWLLLIPLLLLLGLFFLLQQPKQVDVPTELVGMGYDDAVALLEENSLVLGEKVEESNDDVEEGLVFQTKPDSGATIHEGTAVDLYVSLGEELFEMIDYEGEDYEEVRAKLTELGFTVESELEASETVEEDHIIAQDIKAGEEVSTNDTTITFTVSTGRPVISLIDLSGYSKTSVDDYVSDRGLSLTAEERPSDDVPTGQVISQDPEPGTSLYTGERINVVFSTGPEEVGEVSFSHQILLPYEEKLADTEEATPENEEATDEEQKQEQEEKKEENGEQEEEEEKDQDQEPESEPAEPELLPNEIEIYIDDLEKDMDKVAHELSITEDTRFVLSFVVEEGKSATYRVVRDGETVIEETVSP